ncbi:uncharacterized protein BO80DRAFT_475216 [Aspergillus ibericus CBS 121593]|uniref:Uncharacterized protein n=1 Tax=Aspergillus ibericus CBS 121593 TaxID=1448316 RepID=A0A395H0A9_9EURO|nr:hypothetical protein BO80DRAFT_475216 [Aspergillus ibericus CBS 121593]RAL00745.1 hypothetical protein BO80DRAFT_475216 [Aspergillus ibericus CBS 121593]
MHLHSSLLTTLALTASDTLASASLPVRTVYQFSSNDTWLENLAVRSNGIILATEIGPPASLLAFDPRSPNPKKNVLHTFNSVLGLSGITEAAHDIFYVTGANTTSANIGDPPANATHVWRVDFTTGTDTNPNITLIARPTAPTGFNGLAAFNETIVLASTSYQDSIFAIDNHDRTINGLKVKDGFVYWTAGADFCRAPLYENVTAGAGEVIAKGTSFDDFAVSPDGFRAGSGRKFAYAATAAQNSVMQISFDLNGGSNQTEVVAGDGEVNVLYATTGGGSGVAVDVNGTDVAVGAQLLAIRLD